MSLRSSSMSQRCILATCGRFFKRRKIQGVVYCAYSIPVVSNFIQLQQRNNMCQFTRTKYGQNEGLLQELSKHGRTCLFQNDFTNHINRMDLSKTIFGVRHVHSGTGTDIKGKEMREKTILTIPNILSFGRIVACPFLGYLVLSEQYLASLLLFIAAGITDVLDGFIARKYPSQMSYLGSVLDPIADKVLVGVLTVTLTMVHLIPIPLAVIILGRDVGLILSSFVVRFIFLPRPRTFSRFFDVQLPTVQVTPTLLGKVNTALQLGLISLSLTAPVLHFTEHIGLVALQYVVGVTTLASGMDYMITGRGVNILTKTQYKK